MPKKPHRKLARKQTDTPAAQHARFVETAKAVGASEDPKAFDKAFGRVTHPRKPK
jgi:hypothetical protein